MAKAYSLHIGLNSVSPSHYGGWSGDLAGCENDARDMAAISKSLKYSKIVSLLTKKATRANVTKTLEYYSKTLVKGDLLLLSYSGHGGQVPDLNSDEDDHKDETWCLYDGQIVDDEMNFIYSKFAKGVRIFVLSDSCHSGTVTKAAFLTMPGEIADFSNYKFMPNAIGLKTYRQNQKFYDKILKNKKLKESLSLVNARVKLISGCMDNQTSSDGEVNGLFTEKLLMVWNGGTFKGTYWKFYKKIIEMMPPDQSPKYFNIGGADAAFDAKKPFTV